jgi:poly(beta-D-mannuronate) lyase
MCPRFRPSTAAASTVTRHPSSVGHSAARNRCASALAALVAVASGCHGRVVREPRPPAAPSPGAETSARDPLRGPFDVEARRAIVGRRLSPPGAPRTIPPVHDVLGVSYYRDAQRSVVDPVLRDQNEAALRPLRAFVRDVVDLANGWLESTPAQSAYAESALARLDSWARAGALLGAVDPQGEYEREWTLGALALAVLQVRAAPGLDPAVLARVTAWLASVARAVQPHYANPQRIDNRNNHAYWSGLAVAAAGVCADDRELFRWGLTRARVGIAQVQRDGTLPLEMARGRLALHYHVFALAPLVMLAELATANGVALYDEGDRAIARLAARVVEGLRDPQTFAAPAGDAQQFRAPPQAADLAWAEPYAARFPDPILARMIAAARPLDDVRLGGNLTIAFGAAR